MNTISIKGSDQVSQLVSLILIIVWPKFSSPVEFSGISWNGIPMKFQYFFPKDNSILLRDPINMKKKASVTTIGAISGQWICFFS